MGVMKREFYNRYIDRNRHLRGTGSAGYSGFGVKITLEGIEHLLLNLKQLDGKIRNQIARKALRAGSTPVFKAAKRNLAAVQSSKATGKLLKAMYRRFRTYRSTGVTIVVIGPRRPEAHGHLLEFGTTHRYHESGKYVGFVRPRPFLRPAFEQNKNRVIAQMRTTIESELMKIGIA